MVLNLDNLIDKYSLNIKGVIHVGGHIGQEIGNYKRRNIENAHFFEPVKANYERLRVGCEENNYKAYNVALGAYEHNSEIFIETTNGGQSCSLLEPVLHLVQYPHITFPTKEQIEVKTLDSYNIKDCNFLNADVQGYELEVLKGGVETLKFIDYLYLEVNRDEVYKDCAKIEQLEEFLEPYCFKMAEVDWMGSTWGDAFFIKSL